MTRYHILTFVDITKSNAHRNETSALKVGQQANFNSLLQALGLRSNVEWDEDPKMHTGKLPEPLTGKANHWTWEFFTERDAVYQKDADPVGLLIDDLNGVPVVDRLNNSVDIDPAVFMTKGEKVNTWISKISQS